MTPSPFGTLLKEWRGARGVSQLELAGLAASTPRHISFLETGRSRPRRSMVLRIGEALTLPHRERNELLRSAGLPAEYTEHSLETDDLGPYRVAIDAIMASHDPFPACVIDRWGHVLLVNDAFDRMNPGMAGMSPEQLLEATFGSEEGRGRILNWEELAWSYVDRTSRLAHRTSDARLDQLVAAVRSYLGDTPRPPPGDDSHLAVRLAVGDQVLTMFTTFLRFENAHDVTLSELTVELVFPADDETRSFFEVSAGL